MLQKFIVRAYMLSVTLVTFALLDGRICFPFPATKDLDHKAFEYMEKFGYLELAKRPVPSEDSLALTPIALTHYKDGLQRIVRRIQRFGGLTETGELDESTLQLMSSGRCGCPDILPERQAVRSKRYVLSPESWNRNNLTYHVELRNTHYSRKVIRRELDKAFKLWGTYGRIEFTEVGDKRADIVISFQSKNHDDGNPFDGPGGILAHAYFPGEGASLSGDIHFDADEDWSFEGSEEADGLDFFSAAVHELGHSLGLSHSEEKDSIMNPFYKFLNSPRLGADDIMGIYDRFIARGRLPSTPKIATQRPSTFKTTNGATGSGTTEMSRPRTRGQHHECSRDHPYHCHHAHRRNITYHDTSSHVDATTRASKAAEDEEPDMCGGGVALDAISAYRGELLVFQRQWLWRLRDLGDKGQPALVQKQFTQLPHDVRRIDAAFQNEVRHTLVLFSEERFWEFYGGSLKRSGTLSDLGLPQHVTKIDAASEWSLGNSKGILLFSGSSLWLLDERTSTVAPPRELPGSLLSQLTSLPRPLTAAFTWRPDVMSLVKEKTFWTLSVDADHTMKSAEAETILQYIFNCD